MPVRFRPAVILFALLVAAAALPALPVPVALLGGEPPRLGTLALVRDPGGRLAREEVLGRLERGDFELRDQTALDNYGFTDDVLWFAFLVRNDTARGSETMVEVQENNLASVEVHIRRYWPTLQGGWTMERSGATVPIDRRPVPAIPLLFNAGLPAASDSLVLVRVDNRGPNRLRISLETTRSLVGAMEIRNTLLSGFFGMLIILVLINVVMYVSVRAEAFFWFTLQLVFMGLYLNAVSGYGYQWFWPGQAGFQSVAAPMFTCLIVLATLQFQRRLLDTRKAMPRLDKLLLFHLVATPCLLPALLLRYSAGMMAGGVMVLSSMVCILAAAAVSLRRRTPYSLAFTVGFGILMAGAILTQLTTFGMVPAGLALLVMSKADYGGIMLEAMYFTLMLASLVRKLRVERDSAAAKERFSQQFIANVSHEMRTPLNAIIGFAEANDQSDDPVLWRKGNRMILKESEHLLFQINQVLDLARLQAGRLAIEAEPFGLDESLAHLRSLWRERAEHQGLALDLRVAGPAPPRLLGDRLRIEQVLRNLMDNAFKFTEEGTVSLVVVFKPSPGGQVPVTFTVSDTGIGIPEAKQAEIFGEFVQADAGITRRYGGSGLGVSISRRLVEAMGGRLELHSRVGEGSRFSFTLVLGACPAPAAAVVPALPAGPASGSFRGLPARRPRILIVDDQETNRQVAAVHLGKLPVDLDEAEDGLAALARLSERRYDLILLDFYMPGLGGFELARRIRAHPEWTGLPILGLTASSDAADLAEARAAGMDGVLVKPIRRAQLTEQVLALLPELAARADP